MHFVETNVFVVYNIDNMKILKGLSLKDYQHDLDKAAFVSLEKIKAFDKAVDWVIKNAVEEVTNVQQTGSSICVNQDAIPELFNLTNDVARTVDIDSVPKIYTRWRYDIYITTDGDKHPKMIINTGAIDLLTPDELRFMIGHEFGHIKSNHLKYLLLCRYWSMYESYIPGSTLLQIPLFYWSRMTDLTADRVGLLACQNINVALKTMIKMAGAPKTLYDDLNVEAFIEQAESFKISKMGIMNKIIEKISVMDNVAPWMVRRASELLKWYKSGGYDTIIKRYGV